MRRKETHVRASCHAALVASRSAAVCATLGAAAVLAYLPGCDGAKPRRTPQGTFDSLRRAVVEENYEALWDLLSASAREAESARIRAEQMRVEAELPNYAEADRDRFRQEYGMSPGDFVNLSPARVFAMGLIRSGELRGALRDMLGKANVGAVTVEGDRAVLRIEVAGEPEAPSLALVRQHGLYRIPGMQEFLDAFDVAGRARRAGGTPADTYRAAVACVTDGAFGDLWELFSADGREWLVGIVRKDQQEVGAYDDENARMFERSGGVPAADFAAMAPKDAFVVEMETGVGRLRPLANLFTGESVSADIAGEKAVVTLSRRAQARPSEERPDRRGGTARIPMELENGRWHFARME